MSNLVIGIFAGVISATLTLVFSSALPLAILSTYLPFLPILIVTLGWRHQTGLVAVFAGAIVCVIAGPLVAAAYLICIGLPAWGLGYLCLLGRRTEDGMEWYPVGHILFWSACSVIIQQMVLLAAVSGGSFETYLINFKARTAVLVEAMEPQLREALNGPDGIDQWVNLLATKAPAYEAIVGLLATIFMLWLAARISIRNKRIPRPMPFLPAMRMPFWILIVWAVGTAGAVLFDDLASVAFQVFSYAAMTAVCLQGLAVLHDISRNWPQRRLALWVAYIAVMFLPFCIFAVALLGAAEILINIRTKFGGTGTPPAKPSKL